jgi:hypothetical protein
MALDAGLEPRDYQAKPPVGKIIAHLDFKMWGKTPVLRCFFTDQKDGAKFSLTAFRSRDGKNNYMPQDGGIDLSAPGTDRQCYELTTTVNGKGNVVMVSALLLNSGY